jgi:hypothetical protein
MAGEHHKPSFRFVRSTVLIKSCAIHLSREPSSQVNEFLSAFYESVGVRIRTVGLEPANLDRLAALISGHRTISTFIRYDIASQEDKRKAPRKGGSCGGRGGKGSNLVPISKHGENTENRGVPAERPGQLSR